MVAVVVGAADVAVAASVPSRGGCCAALRAAPVVSALHFPFQLLSGPTWWRIPFLFSEILQIILRTLHTTTTTCWRLQHAAFCQNVVPVGTTF